MYIKRYIYQKCWMA